MKTDTVDDTITSVCYARRIYVGANAVTFRDVFLKSYISLHADYRLQGFVLDLSSDRNLATAISKAGLSDEARADLSVSCITADEGAANKAFWQLVRDCDPSVCHNEVLIDLSQDEYPLLNSSSRLLASKWFFGGPSGPIPDDLLRLDEVGDLVDLLICRHYPRRSTAHLLAPQALRDAFARSLIDQPRWCFSFLQFHASVEAFSIPAVDSRAPGLIACEWERRNEILDNLPSTDSSICILSTNKDIRSMAATLLGELKDASRRPRLPRLLTLCAPEASTRIEAVWRVRPLKSGGHVLPVDMENRRSFQPRPDIEKALHTAWRSGQPQVLALVGYGGRGKTAMAQHFLSQCPQAWQSGIERSEESPETDLLPCADAVFSWNFYSRPEVEKFIQGFADYVDGTAVEGSSPSGSTVRSGDVPVSTPRMNKPAEETYVDRIRGGLDRRCLRRTLLVMDGLEYVQVPRSYVSIEDKLKYPLLVRLLQAIAEGELPIVALITTRIGLNELKENTAPGYTAISVGSLSLKEAIDLLRSCAVQGDDVRLATLAHRFGCHAITILHLGIMIRDFYGGNPDAADRLPEVTIEPQPAGDPDVDTINRDLIQVFARYEEHLPDQELEILKRVSTLISAVSVEEFSRIFTDPRETAISGSLTGLSLTELQQYFDSLRKRQLLFDALEPDQPRRYDMHPAVSFYFATAHTEDALRYHLGVTDYLERQDRASQAGATATGAMRTRGAVITRGAVRTRGSAVGPQAAPSGGPTETATLDLLEQIVFHTIRADRREEARIVYERRMGGDLHLNEIGQSDRAVRIRGWLEGPAL